MNSSQLDVHRADAAELRQCFANVFDTWPMADTLEQHIERRLASPQHQAATWYVGTMNGEVATSCGVYATQFDWLGQRIAGLMIGAVHTSPRFRRRGFAAQLIRELELDQQQAGAELSILYSDIPAQYYARLGYQLCPSHEILWTSTNDQTGLQSDNQPAPSSSWKQIRGHWSEHSPMLHDLYQRATVEQPFRVARTPSYWQQLANRYPTAQLLGYESDSISAATGYALFRTSPAGERLILEVIVDPDHSTGNRAAWSELLEAVARSGSPENDLGGDMKKPKALRGWYPSEAPPESSRLQSRTVEQTMLKSLSTRIRLTDEVIEAAGHLQYLDHV